MTKPYRADRRNTAKDLKLSWNHINPYWTNLNAKRAAEKAAKLAKAVAEEAERRMQEAGHKPRPPLPSSQEPKSALPGIRRRLVS